MYYILGSIFYFIAFILITFIAPQSGFNGLTIMNVPTMFYSVESLIIGSMFFIMGFIKNLLTSKPNLENETYINKIQNTVTVSDNDNIIAVVIVIIIIIGITVLYNLHI